MTDKLRKFLNSPRESVFCMCKGREFQSAVVEGKKELRYSYVLQRGVYLSKGLRLWCGLIVDTRGGSRSSKYLGQRPSVSFFYRFPLNYKTPILRIICNGLSL